MNSTGPHFRPPPVMGSKFYRSEDIFDFLVKARRILLVAEYHDRKVSFRKEHLPAFARSPSA